MLFSNRQQRQAGGADGDSRRPIGYWAEFNNWWRTRLSEHGCRPSQTELGKWFDDNAPICWRPDEMPSLKEVRTHAKCLRSTEQVRNYFRKYRAARKATSTSLRTSGSDSDSEDAAPGESAQAIQSRLAGSSSQTDHSRAFKPTRSVSTGDAFGVMPFVFGTGGGPGLFLPGAGGTLAGLALQAAAAAGPVPAPSAGVSSPSSCRPAASACTSQQWLQAPRQPHLANHNARTLASSMGLPLRQSASTATARPAKPLPPAAAAVSGPVISFSSAGQPQHSAHGPGPSRSIGGGIVLQLPVMQRCAPPRPHGSPTKHSCPAPAAPPAKRQATARPAGSGPTGSVCLDLGAGQHMAVRTGLEPGPAPGTVTSGIGNGLGYMGTITYAQHASYCGGAAANTFSGNEQPVYQLRQSAPASSAPPACSARVGPSFRTGGQPASTSTATAMGVQVNSEPGIDNNGACDAAALSPTQAFFHTWEDNDVEDLLMDLPGELALAADEAAMLSAVDSGRDDLAGTVLEGTLDMTKMPSMSPPQNQHDLQHEANPPVSQKQSPGRDMAGGGPLPGNALRWWPDPSADVAAGLPPIRTAPISAGRGNAEDVRGRLIIPTAATVANVLARDRGHEQLRSTNQETDEGLSPASASQLFAILDVPSAPSLLKTTMPTQDPTQMHKAQRDQHRHGTVPPELGAHREGEPTAALRDSYPSMYPPSWPAPAYGYHPHLSTHDSAPDAAAPPPTGPAPPASAPYPPAMSSGYPYHHVHHAHYPPYGYGPPPYSVNSHHPYYYHQLPPPPSSSGYDLYGWPSYHVPPHAMSYPGGPYSGGNGYHGYPAGVSHLAAPPPMSSAAADEGYLADVGDQRASSAHGMAGPPEASSVRARAAASIAARMAGTSIAHLLGASAAAEPLMPGRYVWQATTSAKPRRAAPCEDGEGEYTGASTDGLSNMRSGGAAVRTQTGPQGSYYSQGHAHYSNSVGASQAVVPAVRGATVCGTADECAESGHGRKDAAKPIVAHQLMPPPPPRQPRVERPSQEILAVVAVSNDGDRGKVADEGPKSGPGPTLIDCVLPDAEALKASNTTAAATGTTSRKLCATAGSGGGCEPIGEALLGSDHRMVPVASSTSGCCASPPKQQLQLQVCEDYVVGPGSQPDAPDVEAPQPQQQQQPIQLFGVKQEEVSGYDDADLLDLSSITVGLFSPPASSVQGTGGSRLWGVRASTASAIGNSLAATPNTATGASAGAVSAFAFTPIHTYGTSRSHAFAAPPRTATAAAHQTSHQDQNRQAPSSVPTTDTHRHMATPHTCGSPLDCSLLASWLTSPASIATFDVCARLGLGPLGEDKCDDTAAAVCEKDAALAGRSCFVANDVLPLPGNRDKADANGIAEFLDQPSCVLTASCATVTGPQPDITAHIRITYMPPRDSTAVDTACADSNKPGMEAVVGDECGSRATWQLQGKQPPHSKLPSTIISIGGGPAVAAAISALASKAEAAAPSAQTRQQPVPTLGTTFVV